jgi:hypothetical protein
MKEDPGCSYESVFYGGFVDFEWFLKNFNPRIFGVKAPPFKSESLLKKLGWERRDPYLLCLFRFKHGEGCDIMGSDEARWSRLRGLLAATEELLRLWFEGDKLSDILKSTFPDWVDSHPGKSPETKEICKALVDAGKRAVFPEDHASIVRMARNWAMHNGTNPNYIVGQGVPELVCKSCVIVVLAAWFRLSSQRREEMYPPVKAGDET